MKRRLPEEGVEMASGKSMRIGTVALASLAASGASWLLYFRLAAPSVSGGRPASPLLWVGLNLPVFLAMTLAGWTAPSLRDVPLHALAVIAPPALVEAGLALVHHRPVLYDVRVADPAYWLALAIRYSFCLVVVAGAWAATRLVRGRR
jgi:hypothetical protein